MTQRPSLAFHTAALTDVSLEFMVQCRFAFLFWCPGVVLAVGELPHTLREA